jgi:hypothetical protein
LKAIEIRAKIYEIHCGTPQPRLRFPKLDNFESAMFSSKCGCPPRKTTLGFVAPVS